MAPFVWLCSIGAIKPIFSLNISNTFVSVSSPWSVSEMPCILMFARLAHLLSSQSRCAIRSSSDSMWASFAFPVVIRESLACLSIPQLVPSGIATVLFCP